MSIVPSQHEIVNAPSYDIPYEAMSKADLIELARVQRAQLQAIYTTIGTSNKVLSPMGKLVHIAADVVMSKQQPNEQGLKRLDMEGTAALIGMSSSAVSRTVRNDCTRFGATYEVKTYITKKGQKCKLSYVNSDDPYWKAPQVVDLPPEQLRNLPGDERRCTCGGAMRKRTRVLVSQETWICTDCGEQTVYPPVQENLPLDVTAQSEEEATEEPTEKGLQLVEPFLDPKSADTPVYTGGGIPQELKALPQWVPWRYEQVEETEKPRKVPYNESKPARSPQKARTNDPSTWTTYERATAIYEASQREHWKFPYDGIGFVVQKTNGLVLIDYDHCIADGQLNEQAQNRVQLINSYGETSVSRTGAHQIARGTIPRNIKRPEVEMYDHDRFFTFTGQHLAGTPRAVEGRQAEIDRLFAEIAPPECSQSTPPPAKTVFTSPPGLTDEAILEKARNARNGAKFRKLYDDGKIEGYPSQSEADAALCVMLAYWSNCDEVMIDRLFRGSRLYRDKWERNAGAGISYGEKTIRQAVQA